MYAILQPATAALASAIVCFPVFAVLYWVFRYPFARTAAGFVFCLYLSVLFTLVGTPSLAYWQYLGFDLNLNLIPFVGIPADLKNAVLNVALFVPLGFLLPVLWKKQSSFGKTIALGFGLSMTIELVQMFTYRATDVDDLITNTLGCALGYGIAKVFWKKKPICEDSDLPVFFCITCLVMFFIQPYLLSVLEIWLL